MPTKVIVQFGVFVGTLLFMGSFARSDEGATDEIEEIVVTGSRIARRDFGSPSPIATIDRSSMLNSGQAVLEESLNRMPQVVPHFDRSSNNPGDGTATINLRGFGANRTLVLLDGRRLAPSGVGTSVDVNNLPQALIERVEIITGGATAVYGSDAVAGVVNFIRRDDFGGFELHASAYTTGKGDSEAYDFNVAWGTGFAGDRGNLTLFGGSYRRHPSFAGDRDFTAIPWIDQWRRDGSVIPGGSNAVPGGMIPGPPADLGNGPVQLTFTPDGDPVEFRDPEDRYNYAPLNYLQTPLERYTGGIFLDYELRDTLKSYVELTYAHNAARRSLAPVPASGLFITNVDNPELTPLAQQVFADNFIPVGPGLVGFGLLRRFEEAGPRIFDDTRSYTRILAGLRGDLVDGWDFDVWSTYTRGDEDTLLLNAISRSRMQQGLLVDAVTGQCFDTSEQCAPVNPFGEGRLSPEALAFARMPPLSNTTSREQLLVSGYVRGEPFMARAGPVSIAVGAEWRRDHGDFFADDALFSGDALGFAGSASVNGTERVREIYGELIAPLADTLKIELGTRASHYSNAGSTSAHKIGAEWTPLDAIRLRVMYQRSVRAPNLLEAFQEQFIINTPYVGQNPAEDFCSASADPVGNGFTEKCIATGLPADMVGVFEASVGFPTAILQGGNPELKPEKADTYTAGLVVIPEAWRNLQISVDYFDLEITDTIGPLVPTVACFDPLNTTHRFCDTFGRDPNTFDVNELVQIQVNRGSQRTRGVDSQLLYRADLPDGLSISGAGADLGINIFWTHTFEHTIAAVAGGTSIDCAGRFGWPCWDAATGQTFPEDRVTTTLDYRSGDVTASLAWRWIGGTDNAAEIGAPFAGIPDPRIGVPTVSARTYLDLGIAYRVGAATTARLAILNLGDTTPPFMANAVTSNNTDAALYDVFGRSFSLALTVRIE